MPAWLRSRVLILHAAVFAALTVWSWRKWPDPVIDFGRELYTPWQLTTGKVLYRDVASLFGPFSQYVNTLWFALFGVSLTTLVVCNLIILAAMVYGIHRLFRESCDGATATTVSLVTLALFGFSQYLPVGNYNFVTPYSHEATHSLALSVAIMIALSRGLRTRRIAPFALAGVLLGCVLLTRVETSLAIIAAAIAALAASATLGAEDRRAAVKGLVALSGGALLVPAAFLAYFSLHMPLPAAARAVAGSWPTVVTTAVARSRFYLVGSGMDAPMANAIRMLMMFGGFLVCVGLGCVLDRVWPARLSTWQNVLWRVGRLVLLGTSFLFVPWARFPRALPLISAAALAVLIGMFRRARGDRESALTIVPLLMWGVFALVLLAKMILNARIYHYGFFLALPATLLLVTVLVWLIPRFLADRGAGGRVFRTLAGLMLLAAVGSYVTLSALIYRSKQERIGIGGDMFYALGPTSQWQGAAVRDVLSRIEQTIPPNATMAVLPEGVMINYLARRANPTPYINLMPPELLAFGEDRVLESLQATPPDYVVLVRKDETEYGVPPFGSHANGARIMTWIEEHYRTVSVVGQPPRRGENGIEIMKGDWRRP